MMHIIHRLFSYPVNHMLSVSLINTILAEISIMFLIYHYLIPILISVNRPQRSISH